MLIVRVCVLLLLAACPVWSVRMSPGSRSTLNLRLPDWDLRKIYSSFTNSIGGGPAHRRPSRPKPKPKPNRWSHVAYEQQLDDYYWHNYYYNQALWQQYEHPHYHGGAWPAPPAAPPRIQQDITEPAVNAQPELEFISAQLELAEAVAEEYTNTEQQLDAVESLPEVDIPVYPNTEQQLELAVSVPDFSAETTTVPPEQITTIPSIKVVDEAATNVAVESIIESLVDVVLKTSDVENTVEQPVSKDVLQIATTHTKHPNLLALNQDEITRVKPDFVIAIIPVNTVPVNTKETKIVSQKIVQATATTVKPQLTTVKLDNTVKPFGTLTTSNKLVVETTTVKPHQMAQKVDDAIKPMLTGSGAQIVTLKPHEMTLKKDDTIKPMLSIVTVKTGETVVTTKQPSSNALHKDDGLSTSQKKDEKAETLPTQTTYVKTDKIAGTTTVKPTTTTLIIDDAKTTVISSAITNVKPAETTTTFTAGSSDEKAGTTEPQITVRPTTTTLIKDDAKMTRISTAATKVKPAETTTVVTAGSADKTTGSVDPKLTVKPLPTILIKDDAQNMNPAEATTTVTAGSSTTTVNTAAVAPSSSATSSLQPIKITLDDGVLATEPSNDETVTALPAAIKAAETTTPSAVAANQTATADKAKAELAATMTLPYGACIMFPQLPDCQRQKSQQQQLDSSMPNIPFRVVVHRNPEKLIAEMPRIDASTTPPRMSNSNATLESVSALCRYFPNLCAKPTNAQFVRLTDGHGTPLILVTPGEAPKQLSQKPASLWQPVRMRNETN